MLGDLFCLSYEIDTIFGTFQGELKNMLKFGYGVQFPFNNLFNSRYV